MRIYKYILTHNPHFSGAATEDDYTELSKKLSNIENILGKQYYNFFIETSIGSERLNISILYHPLSSESIDSIIALFVIKESGRKPTIALERTLYITDEKEREKYMQMATLYKK